MNTNNTQYKKYIGMMVPKCLIHSFIHSFTLFTLKKIDPSDNLHFKFKQYISSIWDSVNENVKTKLYKSVAYDKKCVNQYKYLLLQQWDSLYWRFTKF